MGGRHRRLRLRRGDLGRRAPPGAARARADGCLVTPGLVDTHHHVYQNVTRAFRPATGANLFGWRRELYPRWARLDEEASYLSAWVGLAELAPGGATTSTDHLYVHPRGAGDLISAEVAAARELAVRRHTHLAEDRDEDAYAAARFGKRHAR